MYQLQNYTNVGYSNLKNLKNLKNYGSLTLRTIEKRWQFHGKTIALTFLCLNKYPNYPKSVLHHAEPRCPKQSPSLIINSACLPMS